MIESIPSVLRDDVLKQLKADHIDICANIRELQQHYLGKYPPLRFLKEELAERDRQIWQRTKTILQSIKIGSDEGLIPSTLRVLNYAQIPTSPDRSAQSKLTILATFGPALLLFIFFVIRDVADQKIKTEDDLSNVNFLGYLPSSEKIETVRELPYKTKEASSLIRTSINFAMPNDREKCILLTSPLPSEGKTTVAAVLATAMARAGKSTVLVSGDMRRPRIPEMFKLDGDSPGLSDYLTGEKSRNEIIIKSHTKRLDVILSGRVTNDSSDLLSLDRMKRLVEDLKRDYDKVIIDAPPLMMGISDALLISQCVDGVVLVTRFNKTNRLIFNHALKHLKDCGATILGVVINGFDPTQMKNTHYRYYNNYYSYSLMNEKDNPYCSPN